MRTQVSSTYRHSVKHQTYYLKRIYGVNSQGVGQSYIRFQVTYKEIYVECFLFGPPTVIIILCSEWCFVLHFFCSNILFYQIKKHQMFFFKYSQNLPGSSPLAWIPCTLLWNKGSAMFLRICSYSSLGNTYYYFHLLGCRILHSRMVHSPVCTVPCYRVYRSYPGYTN